jgi:hypothetical protein
MWRLKPLRLTTVTCSTTACTRPESDSRYADPQPRIFNAYGACDTCPRFWPYDRRRPGSGDLDERKTCATLSSRRDAGLLRTTTTFQHAGEAGIPRDTPWCS